MSAILGYTTKLSVAPGDEQVVMVSTEAPEFSAELVRIRGPETDFGAGPWFRAEPVGTGPVRAHGTVQVTEPGSYAVVSGFPVASGGHGLTLHCLAQPTLSGDGRIQTLMCLRDQDTGTRLRLFVDQEGRLAAGFRPAGQEEVLVVGRPLPDRQWCSVAAALDPGDRSIRLWQHGASAVRGELSATATIDTATLTIATTGSDRYDGKLARPSVYPRPLTGAELSALAELPGSVGGPVGCWDFAADLTGRALIDVSGHERHGSLVNLPMLGVTGPRWTGEYDDPKLAPAQYDAAYFHSDDLIDAGWKPSVRIPVPTDLPSGLYGVRLTCQTGEDIVPFWVRRAATAPPADVLFLAPTFTYLAYANDRQHTTADFSAMKQDVALGAADAWLHQHNELGASLYDLHPDGTGIAYSSRARPMVNIRPEYVCWLTGAPRHLSADLAVLGWLDRQGVPYDVATDEDLHHAPESTVAGCKVIVTGTHPEYHTDPMLTAIEDFVRHGGRLMYLGGNGFYWVTAVSPAKPEAIEVRRGYAGTRVWDSAPGECHLSSTGEPGGLWRHRGRAPNRLVGNGFAAMGWGTACGYQVADGIPPYLQKALLGDLTPGTVFGEYGWLGGAAGDEVDRADPAQGTPPQTVVLATSTGLGDRYQPVVEEQLSITPGLGGSTNPRVRSDVTYTPIGEHGGAVFAAGSINWAGALPHNHYHNEVATLTGNVLRGFLEGQL